MNDRINKTIKLYSRIGAAFFLASAAMLTGCANMVDSRLSVREEAVNAAAFDLASGAAEAAANREDANSPPRRRFLPPTGESNCYAEPRRQHAATAAMERMLDGTGGEFYSEGGHGGGGGGC